MQRIILSISSALALAVSAGPVRAQDVHASPGSQRGSPVTVTPLARWNAAQVSDHLQSFGLEASHVKYGVDAYRVVYRTIGATGAPTIASTLLAMPRTAARDVELAIWLHGTMVYKGDAPSVSKDSEDRAVAVSIAAAGYVTTAPDYLGLGVGPGTHPYDDRATEVSASLDALRATRTLAEWLQRRVAPGIRISGFSQGGSSSLALARAIDGGADPRFRVAALAAIAGPYDMSGTLVAAIEGRVANVTAYLAYLTVAWNRLHYLYESPSDAFLPPYDQTIESLFDNTHPAEEVLAALPPTLDALFTPAYLSELAAPRGALAAALDQADRVCDFRPSVTPVLYTSAADADVPSSNAAVCRAKLHANGAAADVIDFGTTDHAATLLQALPRVIAQFGAVP